MDLVQIVQRPIIRLMAKRRAENFLKPVKNRESFELHQEKTLERILKANEHTKFGRKFGFSGIGTVRDFQREVPVFTYHRKDPENHGTDPERSLQYWIDLIISDPGQGAGILHPEAPRAMAITSGTTVNEPKLIPQTETALRLDSEVLSTPLFYGIHLSKDAGILDGKIMSWFANHELDRTPNNIPIGYSSGISNIRLGKNITKRMALPLDIQYGTHLRPSGYSGWNEKFEEVIKFCLGTEDKITVQAGIDPILDAFNEMLDQEMMRKGKSIRDVLPDIKLILAGGAPRREYLNKFQYYFGEGIRFIDLFSGSECHVGAGEECIHPYSIAAFLEGIPVKKEEMARDDIQPLSRIGVGEEFKLVITNWKVYRYEGMNDLFKLVQEEPFGMEYIGRSDDAFSLGGAKISLKQILEATNHSEERTDSVSNFVVPSLDKPPNRLYLVASFKREPTDKMEFLRHINDYLISINNEYSIVYGTVVKPPVLKITSLDSKDILAEGRMTEQFKYRNIDKEMYDRIEGPEIELVD